MRDWDTNWDPYEQLLICSNNIQQLAAAYNSQQEVIQQLVQQNNRLTQIADRHRRELTDIRTQLDLVHAGILSKHP
jgi:ABC-type transporter Mla subunit MlaD